MPPPKTVQDRFRRAFQEGDTQQASKVFNRATPERRQELTQIRQQIEQERANQTQQRRDGTQEQRQPIFEGGPLSGQRQETIDAQPRDRETTAGDRAQVQDTRVTGGVAAATAQQPAAQGMFQRAQQQLQPGVEETEQAQQRLQEAVEGRPMQQGIFEQVFGPESRLQSFFAPATRQARQQLLDVQEATRKLSEDIKQRTQDVELTEAQRRRIESEERGELVEQQRDISRTLEQLQAGLDIQQGLSDREFQALQQDAQRDVEAAQVALEQAGLPEATRNLITRQLETEIQRAGEQRAEQRQIDAEARAERRQEEQRTEEQKQQEKQAVQSALTNTMSFLTERGIQPTAEFQNVINDAQRMLDEGATISEVQLGVQRAIQGNPRVQEFLNEQFKAQKRQLQRQGVSTGGGAAGVEDIEYVTGDGGQIFQVITDESGQSRVVPLQRSEGQPLTGTIGGGSSDRFFGQGFPSQQGGGGGQGTGGLNIGALNK